MGKEIKILMFAAATVASAFFLGVTSGRAAALYVLLLDPSWRIVELLLWFVAAASAEPRPCRLTVLLIQCSDDYRWYKR